MAKVVNLVPEIVLCKNENFLPFLERLVKEFKNGEAESISIYVKYANGDRTASCSYAHNPEDEAGQLFALACNRLGFKRT